MNVTVKNNRIINSVLLCMMLILLFGLYLCGIEEMEFLSVFHFAANFFVLIETLIIYNGIIGLHAKAEKEDDRFLISVLLNALSSAIACIAWLLNGTAGHNYLRIVLIFVQYIAIFAGFFYMFSYFEVIAGTSVGMRKNLYFGLISIGLLTGLISEKIITIMPDGYYGAGALLPVPAGLGFVLCLLFAFENIRNLKKIGSIFLTFALVCILSFACSFVTAQLEILSFLVCNAQMMVFCRSFSSEAKRNKYLNSRFKTFISSTEVEKAILSQNMIKEGGEKIEVAILLCRLRNFNELEKSENPELIAKAINHFISDVTMQVEANRGIVLDIPEYGVLAAFGVLDRTRDFTDDAVNAAISIRKSLGSINKWNIENGIPVMTAGIGVAMGESVVGNIGSRKHMRYSAISRIVNLCSRVESQAPDNEVVITDDIARKHAGKIRARQSRRVRLKGFSEPVSFCTID